MKAYSAMTKKELAAERAELNRQFAEAKGKGLKLDMSRGKPEPAQLDMGMGLLDALTSDSDMMSMEGVDTRNYGLMDGITEAKHLMADVMGVSADSVIVFGNSSLSIMYDMISRSVTHGVMGAAPWCRLDKVKFLCPVPGYDRHFAITQHFGIEMIPIPMTSEGPDMDLVEKYVMADETVKGIWCVPKYSNPQGITYSDETVRRFAALKPAAADFRIYWDNAYAIHHLYEDKQDTLLEILSECEKAGNPDMVYEFCSTSKITFSGAGIAAMASSPANLADVKKTLTLRTIGYDKVNQLRHARYFKNLEGMLAHMKKHGYFISFEAMEGCAKEIVAKCKELGVVLTGAGATFPYGKDPKDSNIRIAPTYPTAEEMAQATDVFVLCVKLVSVEKLLQEAVAEIA